MLPGKVSVNRSFDGYGCPVVKDTKRPILVSNGMWASRDGEYQYQVRFFNDKDDNLFSFRYFFNVKLGDTRGN